MKRSIIYSALLSALFIFAGCRKEDDAKLPDLIRVPLPFISKDTTGDATISKDNPGAFKGNFIVDLFFKEDVKPQKMDVVIRKNGEEIKMFKEGITNFPTTIEITGAELESLFGAPLVLGDDFEVRVDITTQNGVKLVGFPANGPAYGANVVNQPGVSTSITYEVVCPFDINDFLGSATIEDPGFWGATYPVTVTLEGEDTYKISGWIQEPDYFILVKVNAAALTATIAKQVYTPLYPGLPYTNWTTEGSGVIKACDKQLEMTLDNTVDQGSFGKATVILRK